MVQPVNTAYHSDRIKDKKYTIITIDTENAPDEIQHPFYYKNKPGIEAMS